MSGTQNVRVTLPDQTLYVSGTVNGVGVTWTNVGENTWEALVERSDDDIYAVELTVIDVGGRVSTASTVLCYGLLNLITDRTALDVARWRALRDRGFADLTAEERSEWEAGMKGAYKHTDWNRVETVVEFVAARLTALGYVFRPLVKKDWLRGDKPTLEDWIRYYSNVATIRELITFFQTTPEAPSADQRLDYERANNIEQILKDADALASLIEQSWYYSGEIFAGEV